MGAPRHLLPMRMSRAPSQRGLSRAQCCAAPPAERQETQVPPRGVPHYPIPGCRARLQCQGAMLEVSTPRAARPRGISWHSKEKGARGVGAGQGVSSVSCQERLARLLTAPDFWCGQPGQPPASRAAQGEGGSGRGRTGSEHRGGTGPLSGAIPETSLSGMMSTRNGRSYSRGAVHPGMGYTSRTKY